MSFKYREDQLITELQAYIEKTYGGHYVGDNNIQAIDLIFAAGHGKGFCVGNVLKYASRYGKKKGHNKDDLMKILHYAILLLYVHCTEQEGTQAANGTFTAPTPPITTVTLPHIVTGNIGPIRAEDLRLGGEDLIVRPAIDYKVYFDPTSDPRD